MAKIAQIKKIEDKTLQLHQVKIYLLNNDRHSINKQKYPRLVSRNSEIYEKRKRKRTVLLFQKICWNNDGRCNR